MKSDLSKNADRFKGFADTYDFSRPSVPLHAVDIIEKYLCKVPDFVVDLGCGTGLSTTVWRGRCGRVLGIEPSEDMLGIAKKKENEFIRFKQAFSDNTGIPDESADVVVCSQSFHWMEPESTLKEVNRILKNGGVFATIDCDWPPVTDLEAEMVYAKIRDTVKTLETELDDVKTSFKLYKKEEHLKNISASGYFRYSREIVFSNTENCTAERFIKLFESQGGFQAIKRKHPELIIKDFDEFRNKVAEIFGNREFSIDFCYRMRIAFK